MISHCPHKKSQPVVRAGMVVQRMKIQINQYQYAICTMMIIVEENLVCQRRISATGAGHLGMLTIWANWLTDCKQKDEESERVHQSDTGVPSRKVLKVREGQKQISSGESGIDMLERQKSPPILDGVSGMDEVGCGGKWRLVREVRGMKGPYLFYWVL